MNDEVVHWNGEGFIYAPAGLSIYLVYLWQPEPNGSPPVAPRTAETERISRIISVMTSPPFLAKIKITI